MRITNLPKIIYLILLFFVAACFALFAIKENSASLGGILIFLFLTVAPIALVLIYPRRNLRYFWILISSYFLGSLFVSSWFHSFILSKRGYGGLGMGIFAFLVVFCTFGIQSLLVKFVLVLAGISDDQISWKGWKNQKEQVEKKKLNSFNRIIHAIALSFIFLFVLGLVIEFIRTILNIK